MNTIRYIVLVPAVLLLWMLVAAASFGVIEQLAKLLCPVGEYGGAGVCYAVWWGKVEKFVEVIVFGAAAFSCIQLASFITPHTKFIASVCIYLFGFFLASSLVYFSKYLWHAWWASILMGLVSLWFVRNRLTRLST